MLLDPRLSIPPSSNFPSTCLFLLRLGGKKGEPSPYSSLQDEQEERNEAGVSVCLLLPTPPPPETLTHPPVGLFGGMS